MSPTAAERVINDPDNHYPYKRKAAVAAGWPEALAEVSERVVKAQEAYLKDSSDENLQERNDAEKEAQRLSSELRGERELYALRQRIEDLEAGNQPASISIPDKAAQ
jgi:hypothetical protein